MWKDGVRRWCGLWAPVVAEHRGPGRFGDVSYWRDLYGDGRGASEWFLDPDIAARSAANVLPKKNFRPLKVFHAGCGLSILGASMVKHVDALVVNADCSREALERLEARIESTSDARVSETQRYQVWEPRDAIPQSDLILDKGTLDAMQFAGSDVLVEYFGGVRGALEENQGGLYLHWSDDPPEMKLDLLTAGFPESDGFRVTWTEEEEGGGGWCYYRYSVVL